MILAMLVSFAPLFSSMLYVYNNVGTDVSITFITHDMSMNEIRLDRVIKPGGTESTVSLPFTEKGGLPSLGAQMDLGQLYVQFQGNMSNDFYFQDISGNKTRTYSIPGDGTVSSISVQKTITSAPQKPGTQQPAPVVQAPQAPQASSAAADKDYTWYVRLNSNNIDWNGMYNTLKAGNISPIDSSVYTAAASPNIVKNTRNGYGLTTLMAASSSKNYPLPANWDRANLVKVLIAAGADVNSKIDFSANSGGWIYTDDQARNWTALNFAIESGDQAVIAALGGIVKPNDKLRAAVLKEDMAGISEAIAAGADQDAINSATNNTGKNALALVVAQGNKDLAKLLITKGANPKIGNIMASTKDAAMLDILDPVAAAAREAAAQKKIADDKAAADAKAAADKAAADKLAADKAAADKLAADKAAAEKAAADAKIKADSDKAAADKLAADKVAADAKAAADKLAADKAAADKLAADKAAADAKAKADKLAADKLAAEKAAAAKAKAVPLKPAPKAPVKKPVVKAPVRR